MNIYVTKTEKLDLDLFQNLLILLNKNKGVALFKPLDESVELKKEEIQTRCIPHDKLWKKFIIQPSLLGEILKVVGALDRDGSMLQRNTFSTNSIYARTVTEHNAIPSKELKNHALLQLIYGMLRISFVKQSYPLAARMNRAGNQELSCDVCMEHDVFVDTKLLFQKCKEQRKKQGLAKDDFLVLFTSTNIDANWLYALDPTYDNNIVINVHPLTNYLENQKLVGALAYYVVAGVLAKLMHWSFLDWYLHQHPEAKGCIMDLNHRHDESLHTMYASKICPSCSKLLTANNISKELSAQFAKILELSRKELSAA